MLPAGFIQLLQDLIPADRLYLDPVDCYAYAYDNSRKYFPPECVIFPLTTAEVVKIVQLCNQFAVPLTPRGRGTGTAGGSLAEQGGASLSMERMTQIISIDAANRVVIAQPGVLNESIQAAVKPSGFFGLRILPARLSQALAEILPPARAGHMRLNMAQHAIMYWG